MFGWGWCLSALVKCATSLRLLARLGPRVLLVALRHTDNLRLGAFLVSYVALFHAVCCSVRRLGGGVGGGGGSVGGMALAGLVAGGSMAWYRSSNVALYLAGKAVELCVSRGALSDVE
jgi:hypothetical protein